MCQRKTYLYSCAHQELQLRPCPSKCWIARRPDVEAQLLRAFSSSGGTRAAVEAGQVYVLRDAAAAALSPSPPSQSLDLESVSVSSLSLLGGGSSAARTSVVNGSGNYAAASAGAGRAARGRARARAAAPSADVVRRIGLCEDCEDIEARVDAVLKREKREKKERRKRRAFRVLGLDIDEVRKAREGVVSRAKARVRRLGKGATGLFRDGGQ